MVERRYRGRELNFDGFERIEYEKIEFESFMIKMIFPIKKFYFISDIYIKIYRLYWNLFTLDFTNYNNDKIHNSLYEKSQFF